MPTQIQIEANRRNAQHSTGPRTAEGKASCSMNALKSGIDAESSVIAGEDAAALAALAEQFYQDCQPQTAIESTLVDNIVRAAWLLRRFDRIDVEILKHMIEDASYPSPNAPVGKAFHLSSTTQSRLQRRINDTHRLQRQAIEDLQRIQSARPQPPSPVAQPDEAESTCPSIGSVPQTQLSEPSSHPLTQGSAGRPAAALPANPTERFVSAGDLVAGLHPSNITEHFIVIDSAVP
jgi:hypothetical protein